MAFAQFLPFTLFGLFAGVITDRLDARRLVIGTQIAQLVTASALTWIALGGFAEPWMLYTIAFVNGHGARARRAVAPAADVPDGRPRRPAERDRAQLEPLQRVADLRPVGRRRSLLGFAGVGVCFLVNAISFLAVLDRPARDAAARVLPARGVRAADGSSPARSEGLAYVRRQPRMLVVLALTSS